MKLQFLGTRGEIDLRTRLHRMHSSLLVSYRGRSLMLDCGADWLTRLPQMKPDVIVLTHAHPDHAWGLKKGVRCEVFATEATWRALASFPVPSKTIVAPRSPFRLFEIELEAFPVEHSMRAPAAGYRIRAGRSTIFYVPDVVCIVDLRAALEGVDLYIGDGAVLRRPLVRASGSSLVGHSSIRTQLDWCRQEGVRRAYFTHCGTEVVRQHAAAVNAAVQAMGAEAGVDARIAVDGLVLRLR